jgi:hypothetical protein
MSSICTENKQETNSKNIFFVEAPFLFYFCQHHNILEPTKKMTDLQDDTFAQANLYFGFTLDLSTVEQLTPVALDILQKQRIESQKWKSENGQDSIGDNDDIDVAMEDEWADAHPETQENPIEKLEEILNEIIDVQNQLYPDRPLVLECKTVSKGNPWECDEQSKLLVVFASNPLFAHTMYGQWHATATPYALQIRDVEINSLRRFKEMIGLDPVQFEDCWNLFASVQTDIGDNY